MADSEQQLVDAIRMLEVAGIIDYNGHGSIRTGEDRLLINSGASNRGALDVSQLVEIDLQGRRIRGAEGPPMEYHIHAEIYRARPDVHAIIHAHPKWSTVLTIGGHRLKPVYAQGTLLRDVPVFANPLSVNTRPVGEQLAATLGEGRAVLMRAHGATIVGAGIVEAFSLAMYMEENAHRQYLAMQIGEVYEFTEDEQRACERNLYKPRLFDKVWEYQRSKIS